MTKQEAQHATPAGEVLARKIWRQGRQFDVVPKDSRQAFVCTGGVCHRRIVFTRAKGRRSGYCER